MTSSTRGLFFFRYSSAPNPVGASARSSSQYGGKSAAKSLIARWRSDFAARIGAPSLLVGRWLLSVFTIHGSNSQDENAATFPVNPGRPFSHSSTVTFGFGMRSLLLMRGSGKPDRISL